MESLQVLKDSNGEFCIGKFNQQNVFEKKYNIHFKKHQDALDYSLKTNKYSYLNDVNNKCTNLVIEKIKNDR